MQLSKSRILYIEDHDDTLRAGLARSLSERV